MGAAAVRRRLPAMRSDRMSKPASWVLLGALLLAACGGGGEDEGLPRDYPRPIAVTSTLRFVELQTSQAHTCGVATDGSSWCWGVNRDGELGTRTTLDTCDIPGIERVSCTGTPQRVAGAPAFTQLVLTGGYGHSCGLDPDGRAWCWGFGLGGQLGDGLNASSSTPVAVAGDHRFERLRISDAAEATCGVTAGAELWCWGYNWRGLLGNGQDDGRMPVPERVDWGLPIVDFDLGQMHGCGISAAGQAWCWGNNWYGQLGVGSAGGSGGLEGSKLPLAVVGSHVFRAIAAGLDHSCALDDAGAAWCWGTPSVAAAPANEIYVGSPRAVPGGHRFIAIRSGQLHTCALTTEGEAWCWGQNYNGELGDGTRTPGTTPVKVDAPVRFARLSDRPTCALTAEGEAWCWGNNSYGQVGRRSHYAP